MLLLLRKVLPMLCLTILLMLGLPSVVPVSEKTIDLRSNESSTYYSPHECRFWAMSAVNLPEAVVMNHLVTGSSSLKSLGAFNNNGWGLAYYDDTEPTVLRGELPANADPAFDLAAQELAGSGAKVGVGHVRLATSGASDIPNPHPFMRFKGGKWWAYGHNGGLSKNVLRQLIGPEYLESNPPTVGSNWSDPRVVDSELYFLYVLKCTEEAGWNVTAGIARTVGDILQNAFGTMNFFLTDGETIWGFRMGNTLYYYYSEAYPHFSSIASQPPSYNTTGWAALEDYNLVVLTAEGPPIVIENVIEINDIHSFLWVPVVTSATLAVAALMERSESAYRRNDVPKKVKVS